MPLSPDYDGKALRTLLDSHWGPNGWNSGRTPAPDEVAHAKSAGFLFDPLSLDHDGWIERAADVAGRIDPKVVAGAFVASLGSRDLPRRSALGSFAVLRHLATHRFIPGIDGRLCAVCGLGRASEEGLSVLNFERFKWGGVRRLSIPYCWFDLDQFRRQPVVTPAVADVRMLEAILKRLESAPAMTTGAKAARVLNGLFPSNGAERTVVVQILSVAGVLEDPNHPGFRERFIRAVDREMPSLRFMDVDYPAIWWRDQYGVDRNAVSAWFGEWIA